MGCASSVVKYILFLLNLIFVLAGIAFLAIGIILQLNLKDYTNAIEKMDNHFSLAPTLIIIVGCIVFIIAFFGCCGAIRESTCMLTTYAIILLIIFIVQIAVGIFAFLQIKDNNDGIKNDISKELGSTFEKYTKDKIAQEAVDSLQYGLQCCGLKRASDWNHYMPNGTLPDSCCPNKQAPCHSNMAFPEGCADKLYDFICRSVKTIGIVAIVIAAIELGGAVIALCLSSSIRNYERRGNYA